VLFENPRPLSDAEKCIIDFLLSQEFPGADELRSQVDQTLAIGKCDCGCPTINLKVAESAPRSLPQSGRGPLPYEGSVAPGGDDPVGGIILFSSDGYLSSLEFYGFEDSPPHDWPNLDQIDLVGPLR
jgi:hypothetical protein